MPTGDAATVLSHPPSGMGIIDASGSLQAISPPTAESAGLKRVAPPVGRTSFYGNDAQEWSEFASFNGSGTYDSNTGIFSIAGLLAVPEIDPAGFGSVAALVTGALGLLERRRPSASRPRQPPHQLSSGVCGAAGIATFSGRG